MSQDILITSSSNEKFKFLQKLNQSKERKKEGLTMVEGLKEIQITYESKIKFETIFYSDTKANLSQLEFLKKNLNCQFYELSHHLFEKIAYRESTGGIIAIVKPKILKLNELKLNKKPLILVLDGIEKPGNIGAILRTAEAVNVDVVICSDLKTDLYNPNTIRASLGTVFSVPIVSSTFNEVFDFLTLNKISIFSSFLHTDNNYSQLDYKTSCAIVVGSEDKGISENWVKNSQQLIKIPMKGKIDSMNVSVAAAVLLHEAMRQRDAYSK